MYKKKRVINLHPFEVVPVNSVFSALKSTTFTDVSLDALASKSPFGFHLTQLTSPKKK